MAAALFLLPRRSSAATAETIAITNVLATFIPEVESFSSTPYWDVSRWSWGYGTRVPNSINDRTRNPGGTISRQKAFADMISYLQNDYEYLHPKVKRLLKANQWAAFLSFSYNLGSDDAVKLIPNINNYNDPALFAQWDDYVYSGGVKNTNLIIRREKEIALWKS